MVFPSHRVASRCVDFLRSQVPSLGQNELKIVELVPNWRPSDGNMNMQVSTKICATLFPEYLSKIAKSFWQHTGEGVSSRRAEFAHRAYEEGALVEAKLDMVETNNDRLRKGPRRYQKGPSTEKNIAQPTTKPTPADSHSEQAVNSACEGREYSQYIEERFGRNLDLSFVRNAKLAIRRRIAGSLIADVDLKDAIDMPINAEQTRQVVGFSEGDVYLYPTGMSSIFNTHRALLAARGPMESVCFG
jgi:cystathionine gamma-synthase